MESLKELIGQRLKESRQAKKMTQKQVAALLHMTQQQYSRFENGIFELDYQQLTFLCKLYDVSSDYILGLNDY